MAMMPPPSGVPGGLGLVAPNNLGIASSSSTSAAMLSPSIPPGHATLRLLEYFDALAGKGSLHGLEIHDLNFWRSLTHTFYSPDGVFRLIAWNPSTREQRSFELPTPVIPRYLHTVHLSGVTAHSMSFGHPREWSVDQLSKVPEPPTVKGCSLGSPNSRTTHFIQVDRARMDIEYESGWTVVQKGILRAALTPIGGVLKLQFLDFVVQDHHSLVPRSKIQRGIVEQPLSDDVVSKIRGAPAGRKKDGKKAAGSGDGGDDESKPGEEERNRFTQPVERWSMPENPVNEYGMTLRAMRCLEITESVCQLRDLMEFASQHTLGPMQALQRLAGELRASRSGDQQEGGVGGHDGTNASAKRKGGGASGEGGGGGGAADGNVKTEAGDEELPSRSSPAKRMR